MQIPFPLSLHFKGLLILGGGLAIAYLAACLFLFTRQNRFIFLPAALIEVTPEFFQLPYEEVWLPVPTGGGHSQNIHGWWMPAPRPETGVLLYLHGNGANIGANVSQAYRFHQLGFSVFLIDYRGYGLSHDKFPTEATVYQDSQVAWDYLIHRRQINPDEIFLYGHSLGGAIAINLAVQHPEAAGLIVESSFTSMRDVVDSRGKFRLFPVDLLLTQRFDSISKVKSLKLPVLFIHGTADPQIPAWMSEALFAATPVLKQLELIPGADHNHVAEVGGSEYLQAIESFVTQVRSRQPQLAEGSSMEGNPASFAEKPPGSR
ncbi:MAG TPA: alpha/beta hydrolase [Candidatus Caenarcaniphilales bacterium]